MNNSAFKSSLIAVAAALVGGGLVYLLMRGATARLEGENQQLRAQLAELSREREAASTRAESAADKAQREKEQTELLRLRGEVGVLRKQKDEAEKLRKANVELTAALAKVAPANSGVSDPEADPERRVAVAHLNVARQMTLGLRMFGEDNQNVLPATLGQISVYLDGSIRPLTNQFELVLQRPIREVEDPSSIIVIRQKEAWLQKGNWVKVYGFADGHTELKKEPPEGFETWEQQHIQPAPR